MLYMLYIAMNQTNEMLDENYYVLEKEYQGIIDAELALQEIITEPLVRQDTGNIVIYLPENSFDKIHDARVDLIKPDNEKLDTSFELRPESSGVFKIAKSSVSRGVYKIRVQWKNGDVRYYRDENLFIE